MVLPLPLAHLSEWAPFQLDALGLVTIFGAKEMNSSIGSLVHSWVAEWLPVLGSYSIANNDIVQSESGFVLYNISDGIMATDVSAWFTRWLMSFPLTYTATSITLRIDGRPLPTWHPACSMAIGLFVLGMLLTYSIVSGDAWGIANVAAMTVSVLFRQQIVSQLRRSIDKSIDDLKDDPDQDVKVFLTLPNGKAVTIHGPRLIVTRCLLTDPQPLQPIYYYLLRVGCWAAFGVHAITLGMSSLFDQILTVVVLLLATYITAVHAGACREMIGTRLRLEVDLGDPEWSRKPAYARLNMSDVEEDRMVHWSMMPHRSNVKWWEDFRTHQAATKPTSTETKDIDTESSGHGTKSALHAIRPDSIQP